MDRSLIVRVSALLFLMVMHAATALSASPAEPKTLRVGLYENEPKIFTDTNGKPAGLFVEILAAIASQEGLTLTWIPCEWQECLTALRQGRIDVMPDVAYSRERDEIFDFHRRRVFESWSQVFAQSPRIQSMTDLAGQKVAILRGSVQESVFDQLMAGLGSEISVVHADSLTEAFRMTANGAADAVVANHFFGERHYHEYGLVKTPVVFHVAELFYAVPAGRHREFLAIIDRYLESWSGDPASLYYKALQRWMDKPQKPLIPKSIIWTTGILAGLLCVAGVFVVTLRAQDRAKSARLKRASEELSKTGRQLQESQNALLHAYERAEQSRMAKSEFLATMSHELRTPLTAIIGFTELLLTGPPEIKGSRRELGIIHSNARHLLELISTILDLRAVETNSLTINLLRMDPAAETKEVLSLLKEGAIKKGIAVISDFSPDFPTSVVTDPVRFRQILVNIVGNAIKFTNQGQVRLHGFLERAEGKDWVVVNVQDTGCGIAEANRDMIFEKFTQEVQDLAARKDGAGLGLHLSRALARALGGDVTLKETRKGAGSTFSFTLPVLNP